MLNRNKRYSARKLLGVSTAELHKLLQGEFILVFDDGEMEVTARSTLISSYVWDFHRLYPLVPLLKEHHCASLTAKSTFGSKTHIKLLERVAWAAYDTYVNLPNALTTNQLAKMIYEISNQIYNDMVLRTENSVVSLDILDFIEIMEHPPVKEVLDNVSETPAYIDNSYKAIREAVYHTPSLATNNLVKATRAGLVREGQVYQCLGPRGYVTDMDSHFFKFPITRGFAKGLRKFSYSLVESRSAAKSLASNKMLISDAEYFARRLQILCQVVETVHPGDCGSTHYLRWKLRDKEVDENGKKIRNSDLETLQGKYYLDEVTGKLNILKPDDTKYLGKILKFRSPISGCRHPDPNGICSVCFGELYLNVPKGTNLGHLCAANMTQQTNQNILSTKHYLDGSSLAGVIKIPVEYKNYLDTSPSGNGYVFKDTLKNKENYMIFTPNTVPGLVDLSNVENLHDLGLSHVSEIKAFGFRSLDKNGVEDAILLNVAVDRRLASLTHPMLEHIRRVGWSFDDKGNYVIQLNGWDYSKAAFVLPMRQYNMSDHATAISIAIESSQQRIQERDGNLTPEYALIELSDLVNSKLSVNIALLEVILLGSLIQSSADKNYFIPKEGTKKEMSVAATTIANRSLSGVVAYNAMAQNLVDPSSLFHKHRPQLMMDIFIKPRETLEDPYRYKKYFYDYPK